jgi:hypothetical protein
MCLESFRRTYLRCQVESQVAAPRQGVFHQQWHLLRQAKLDFAGETASFAEVDEIFQREGERDWLGQVDSHVLIWLVNVLV